MKLQIALLGLLASLPGAVQAAPFVGVDLPPLLKVHEERTVVPTPPFAQSFHFDDDLLVTQNGEFSTRSLAFPAVIVSLPKLPEETPCPARAGSS
jgi:hypothetical protein